MSDEVQKKPDVENSKVNPEESLKEKAAGDGESTEQKKKFSVLEVKFGPDPAGDTRGEHSNESSLPSSPIRSPPSPEHFTQGYASNEAIPMTIFYRSQHSHGHGGKQRPTLQQLRKGLENDKVWMYFKSGQPFEHERLCAFHLHLGEFSNFRSLATCNMILRVLR